MDYVDDLYRKMMASSGRLPASDMFPAEDIPYKGPSPKSAPVIRTQPTTVIDSEKQVKPIEFDPNYKINFPQTKFMVDNINDALITQQHNVNALESDLYESRQEKDGYTSGLKDILTRMQSLPSEPYKNEFADSQIKTYQEKMAAQPESFQRSDLADAIMMMGPAILGSLTGEAGALSALPAGKAAYGMYEGSIKNENDRLKTSREVTEKKLKAMIDLKKSGQESYDKSQERDLNRIKAELEATKTLNTDSANEIKEKQAKIIEINNKISEGTQSGAKAAAQMEMTKYEQEQKNKRTPKFEKKEIPLDVKKKVEKLSSDSANMFAINSQIEELRNQVGDESIPKMERVASAKEQLKLLNSTLGADAVGAEETKRLAAYLDYNPNFIKMSFGPDLEGFYNQLDRTHKRIKGASSNIDNEINKLMGRPHNPPAADPVRKKPEEEKPKVETREVNGVTYEKVDGGWKRAK